MDVNKRKVKKVLRKQNPDASFTKPKLNWIDQCYEETMFSTNPNWEKIQDKIGRQIAVKLENRIQDDLTDKNSQQTLFKLLGKQYVEEYLPSYKFYGSYLLTDDKLLHKMKRMLEEYTKQSYEELGYLNLSSEEMREYRNDVRNKFNETIEKKLKENKKRGRHGEEKPVNLIGKALMKVLHRDPQSIVPLITRLKEQVVPMPSTLRKCIYVHQLIKKAEESDDSVSSDVMALKKELKGYLMESKGNGNAVQPIRSEEWRKIDKAVIDVYHSTPGLRGIDTDEHLMTTSRVLNLLHKASSNYKQSLIYWLCPFLLAFESHSSLLRDEAVVEVAALFDLVDRFLIPTHAQIFSITHKAVDTVFDEDKQFYNHLVMAIKKNPAFNSKDFTLEVLHIEHEKAHKLMAELRDDHTSARSVKIITNPQTYIRRWVADGFLQSLRLDGSLFLWDQLFYSKWNPKIVEKAVLVVLMLLKPWFMRAENYQGIRRVFVEEPARLYTSDIRRAWRHLSDGKDINDIGSMNRNILQRSETPPPPPAVYTPPAQPLVQPVLIPVSVSSDSESESEDLGQLHVTESETEEESEPEPPPEPEPEPDLDKREDIFSAWLPFNKAIKSKLPTPSRINAPFDLYIDAVRFLPDNATIVKVTGKILNTGDSKSGDEPDIIAYPDLKSPGQRPEFKFKLPIHGEQILLNPNVLLLLRVYTIEKVSKELVILGSCLCNIFRTKPSKTVKLRVGGHQARLRRGFPKGDDNNLSASSMDENLPIPCATVLFRLLPHSVEYIEMPDYNTHYYHSKHAFPTESECNIYEDYMQRPDRDQTVMDVIKNKLKQSKVNDTKKVEAFMKQVLERKKKSNPQQINLNNLVDYNKTYGVALLAEEAHRLPVLMSGKFFQTVLQMLPGKKTSKNDKMFTVLTEKLELESSHLDPNWMDAPSKVNPEYDENSVLFVQIFGLNVDYEFPSGTKPGRIQGKNGNELKLDLSTPLAWTVIPMFKNGVVNVGTFLAPLIKHYPTKKLIQSFKTQSVEKTFNSLADEIKFCEGSSIEVTLWDGHFITTECPPLTKTNHLVKLAPKPSKYMKAINAKNETSFVDLLINAKVEKEGPESWIMGSDSTKVQENFLQLFNAEFVQIVNKELSKKGLEPIVRGGVDLSDSEDAMSEEDTDED